MLHYLRHLRIPRETTPAIYFLLVALIVSNVFIYTCCDHVAATIKPKSVKEKGSPKSSKGAVPFAEKLVVLLNTNQDALI